MCALLFLRKEDFTSTHCIVQYHHNHRAHESRVRMKDFAKNKSRVGSLRKKKFNFELLKSCQEIFGMSIP
jgi:hypothetical protein